MVRFDGVVEEVGAGKEEDEEEERDAMLAVAEDAEETEEVVAVALGTTLADDTEPR